VTDTDVARPVAWGTCRNGNDCRGAQASPGGYCWQHAENDDQSAAFDVLAEERDLDLRGTDVPDYLLKRILDRLRDPADGRIRIRAARCAEASFGGGTSFAGAIFIEDAQFNGAVFGADTSFANARFQGRADFASATFSGLATFTRITCDNFVSFEGARFDTVRFSAMILGGGVSFRGASVAANLSLELGGDPGTLVLDGLHAGGQVDLRTEAAAICCQGATFADRVRFLLADGPRLTLSDTVFAQPAVVESWQSAVRGSSRADDHQPQIQVRSLRGVDAEHLTLADVDLSNCLIYGLRRPEELRLSGRCRFAPTPRGWYLRWKWLPWHWTYREALYEEHLWRRRPSVKEALGWRTKTGSDETPEADPDYLRPAGLAVLYRQLRKAVEDARNEPGAADLYYGEMEMRRLSTPRTDERWLLTVYWLVSGYGLRASRSMLVLGALVLASALALQRAGFGGPTHGYPDCLLYAAGSVLSLDLSGHLPAQLTDWGQLIRMVLRIGGPVLLGLGALAVRGRVKR
jgi:hypothetical protein